MFVMFWVVLLLEIKNKNVGIGLEIIICFNNYFREFSEFYKVLFRFNLKS